MPEWGTPNQWPRLKNVISDLVPSHVRDCLSAHRPQQQLRLPGSRKLKVRMLLVEGFSLNFVSPIHLAEAELEPAGCQTLFSDESWTRVLGGQVCNLVR